MLRKSKWLMGFTVGSSEKSVRLVKSDMDLAHLFTLKATGEWKEFGPIITPSSAWVLKSITMERFTEVSSGKINTMAK